MNTTYEKIVVRRPVVNGELEPFMVFTFGNFEFEPDFNRSKHLENGSIFLRWGEQSIECVFLYLQLIIRADANLNIPNDPERIPAILFQKMIEHQNTSPFKILAFVESLGINLAQREQSRIQADTD